MNLMKKLHSILKNTLAHCRLPDGQDNHANDFFQKILKNPSLRLTA